MWILSDSQKRRDKITASITNRINEQSIIDDSIWVDSPAWYKSLRNDIASVDKYQEEVASKNISDLIKHRITLRKWIVNGSVTSWNEAADYLELRRWGLVDMFSDYMMQNKDMIKDDASAKLLQEKIKTDPDSIIWYMKESIKNWYPDSYQEKNKAIDDYIMKWGKLDDVMNFVIWESEDPYWTPKEKKIENTNPILNFLWSITATPIRELWWLSQIVADKTWLAKEQENEVRKTATVEWASTQWYNEYKATWKLPSKRTEDYENLYKWYDDAVNDWFIWSVEEYNNYLWDVAVAADKTFKKLTDDFTEKYLYNPEERGSTLWNIFWDIAEIVLVELASAGTATPELAATKIPKVAKAVKWLWSWLKWWAELQALEDAYEWEVSDVPEYAKTMFMNLLLKWWFESLWKLAKRWIWTTVKKFWWITERWEIALSWETPTSSAEKIKIIQESKWTNPERTPQKEIAKRIKALAKTVSDDLEWKRTEQRNLERAFKWEQTPEELTENLNKNFAELKDSEIMWEQTSKITPEFRVWASEEERLLKRKAERAELKKASTKKWKEEAKKKAEAEAKAKAKEEKRLSKMSPEERADELRLKEIEAEKTQKASEEAERKRKYELTVNNEDLLKSWYSKDRVALIDILKEEWNKMFVKEWREFNASNLWELTKLIESKSSWTEWTKRIVEAIKNTMEWISKNMWEDFNKLAKENWSKSDILNWLNAVLWRLSKRTSEAWTEIGLWEAWEKALWWNLRELLSQAKKFYPEWDLNKEIDSWLIHLAIYDPEAAVKIAKDIYPSIPWILEMFIKWWKMIMTKKAAKNIVEKNAPEVWKRVWVWDAIWRSVRWKTAEWAVDIFF